MLNILLSALIDPERRLRSFRRSERLASILVCIIPGAFFFTLLSFFFFAELERKLYDPVTIYSNRT